MDERDRAAGDEIEVPTDPAAYTDVDARPGPPKMLSPSRMEDYGRCPRQFFYKSILKLPTSPSEAAAKGTVAHAVLEDLFSLPREQRTEQAAVDGIEEAFAKCLDDDYHGESMASLFEDQPDPDAARAAFLGDVERFVRNYFTIENPRAFDPEGTERWVRGFLSGHGYVGIVDRLDRVELPGGERQLWVTDYKGLALDTELPTADGWTTMGEVAVGDRLLGADGRPTTVTGKSSVHHRRCFQVRFEDGTEVVCDLVHLWAVRDLSAGPDEVVVLDAESLCARFAAAPAGSLVVDTAAVLELDDDGSRVDAYRTGAGLAAGGRVPPSLLRAGEGRRRALLDGLVDSAGRVEDGRVRLDLTVPLAGDVAELVATLGTWATVDDDGAGGAAVRFQLVDGAPGRARAVVAVEEVASVPTQCVEVDADDSLYLCTRGFVPTHNSGKMPQLRWAADKFNAMKVYAVLLHHELDEVPRRLRLVYIAGQGRDRVLQLDIDEGTLDSTRARMKAVSAAVARSHARWDWPARTSKLCNWCDFQEICPAMGGPLADTPVTVRRRPTGRAPGGAEVSAGG